MLERGWLSSNNTVLHGDQDGEHAWLVDSSHVLHTRQTVALLQHLLGGDALGGIVNTHLHSDHCGGNAGLQARWGCPVWVPSGSFEAAVYWDEDRLGYRSTGQLCQRFDATRPWSPGEHLRVGGRRWDALAAPGHDPDSLILWDEAEGVLISADALWEHGFGVVFPELEGRQGFDEVEATLDLIERLQPRLVIPGHGSPFADATAALARARQRLAGFRADPARHALHGAKVLLKYHLMEVQRQARPQLQSWAADCGLLTLQWQRWGQHHRDLAGYVDHLVQGLVAQGALGLDGDTVVNR